MHNSKFAVSRQQIMNTEGRFLGYCKYQIQEIHDHWWERGTGVAYVKYQESEEDFLQIPLVAQYMKLMELCAAGIKLTPNGYLPNKVVAEIYPLGPKESRIEEGKVTLGKHSNCYILCQTYELFLKTGFVKKRKGVLSLTKKGKELLGSPEELFRELLYGMSTEYDTAFLDVYDFLPMNNMVQMLCALLAKYGKEFRPVDDYADAYAACNPILASYLKEERPEKMRHYAKRAFCVRLINRFFEWFGLVEFKHFKYGSGNILINPDMVRTTELFDKFIGINPPVTKEQYGAEVAKDCVHLAGSTAKRFFEWMGLDPEDFPEDALDNCEPGEDDEKIFDMLTNPTKYLS